MTKSELIARLSERFPTLIAKDCEITTNALLGRMAEALFRGDRVEIRGFGSFALNYRPPRQGRNPRSGEKVSVPEKYVPHFKPGKELRERIEAARVPAVKTKPALTVGNVGATTASATAGSPHA